MDNNQPVVPPAPVSPVQPPKLDMPQPQESSRDSRKMLLFLILGIVIIILVVGGIYYYLSRKQSIESSVTSAPAASQNSISKEPTQNSQPDGIKMELDSINIDSIDGSMSEVDEQLKGL